MTDIDDLPLYEGKDPELLEAPRCFYCLETPARLLRCSRCQLAWYCSATCQKVHYEKHSFLCKNIAKDQKRAVQEKARLCAAFGENIFETEAGNFYGLTETYNYLDMTNALISWTCSIAYQSNVKQVWEKALFLQLEHLRLGALDRMRGRIRLPFFLLQMNRDDDAVSFIQHWVKLKDFGDTLPDWDYDLHRNSNEGDWIYPREVDCRYSDMFKDVLEDELEEVDLSFLVALFIIKLRLIAAHDLATQYIAFAFEGISGRRIQEVRPLVEEMVIRQDVDLDSQRAQAQRLFDVIHRKNPSMLPAIVNPRPIMSQRPPNRVLSREIRPGHPSEVQMILNYGKVAFHRVPGALGMLVARFGDNPVYNWSME
jgi:hypothetical protein